jgi:hypothetical protein
LNIQTITGGGAGGVNYSPYFVLSPGAAINGNVGAGGARYSSGGASSFSTISALGGGFGGEYLLTQTGMLIKLNLYLC